jgi:predicted AAA+ superfamily ATPase
MNITLYLLSNIGKECTFNRLKNSFELGSANTASDYLHWLEDSYLLYFLPRFSYSARKTQVNPRKVYAVDNGMITANTLSYTQDQGRLLENAVYLHLRRQAYTLYYYQEKKECDFVVFDHKQCRYLLQVCMEVNSDTLGRETSGLLEAMAFFKLSEGYIITLNQADTLELEGRKIYLVPAHVLLSGGGGV